MESNSSQKQDIQIDKIYMDKQGEFYFVSQTEQGVVATNPDQERFLVRDQGFHLSEIEKQAGFKSVVFPNHLKPLSYQDVYQQLQHLARLISHESSQLFFLQAYMESNQQEIPNYAQSQPKCKRGKRNPRSSKFLDDLMQEYSENPDLVELFQQPKHRYNGGCGLAAGFRSEASKAAFTRMVENANRFQDDGALLGPGTRKRRQKT